MQPSYINVQACWTCPNCLQDKGLGLILCWPCHNMQRQHNNGKYSARCERRIAEMDAFLGAQHENMVKPI